MSRLLLVPLEDAVVFPGMSLTLAVDTGEEERVLLVPRHEQEFAAVGTVAEVTDRVRLPAGARAITLMGLHRGVAGAAHTLPDGRLYVEVEERSDEVPVDGQTRNLEREYRAVVEEILELRGDNGRVSAFVRSITEPGSLADTSGYSPDLSFEQKVKLLQTTDVTERLELALGYQRERLAELQVRKRIRDDVESGAERQQREYFLRKQMESIRKELGEDDGSIIEEYRTKIAEAGMPDHAREQAEKELGRLERMGEQSGESSVIRTYLDWLIAVPWSKHSEERLDPQHAREVLDADHAGLAHARVGEQHFFDFARIDIGPAGDDDVLGAIFQRQEAVGIEDTDIAGMQPAVLKGVAGRGFVFPVALHDHRPAYADLAARSGWKVAAVGAANRNFDAELGVADGSQTLRPTRIRGVGDDRARQHGDGHRRFALTIDLHELLADDAERVLQVGEVHRAAAVDDGAERARATRPRSLGGDDALDHGRRREQAQAGVSPGELEHFVFREPARCRNDIQPAGGDESDVVETRAMRLRRRVQQDIARRHGQHVGQEALRRLEQVGVRQHDTLRPPRRAARVEEPRHVVGITRRERHGDVGLQAREGADV